MAIIVHINRSYSCKMVVSMDVKNKLEMLTQSTPSDLVYKFALDNKFPINIRELLNKLDIKVIPYDFSNLEKNLYKNQVMERGVILGAVVSTKDEIGIFYRKDDPEVRIRFTLAHELAHCCLHPDDVKEHIEFRNDSKNPDAKEYEANVFAGELLIPEEPLKYAITNLINPKIEYLTEIFGVSAHVMQARLDYLDIKIND